MKIDAEIAVVLSLKKKWTFSFQKLFFCKLHGNAHANKPDEVIKSVDHNCRESVI